MSKEEYDMAVVAFKAAIHFTDIDADKTQEEFSDWFTETTGIVIPYKYLIGIINDHSFSYASYDEAN